MWNFTKDHDAVLFDDVVNIRESGDMVLCHWDGDVVPIQEVEPMTVDT